ncbi:hypothetical protein [Streptomyces hydrogenans]|uniref:DUF3618 domain-containing protein n=1 Tax=Streptomyces hydrogenans TaxID=1873719 RepID=A0ABQ3PJR8_9ACTN|nr:hypothetical protein [Streptomyces hydrogenans]GHG09662.1 hypothetical protein GCM10018784_22790 [Streptomyces hydrogenans]GHI25269.1 hypothetical protein Shyd_66400 [Streptomyces hydrogenans]
MTSPSEDSAPSVWSELRAQRDLLIELKVKLERVEDHELRLRKLEERKFPLPTIAVILAFLSIVANVTLYVISK